MAMASSCSPSCRCYSPRKSPSSIAMLLADKDTSSLSFLPFSAALLPSTLFPFLPPSSDCMYQRQSEQQRQKQQQQKQQQKQQQQKKIISMSDVHHHQNVPRSSFSRGMLVLLTSLILQEEEEASSSRGKNTAIAFSLGISGPKEWLKGQKKKTSEFLIAPILASRERLKNAMSLAESNTISGMEEAQRLVNMAARDCLKPEDGSIIAFQVKTGVEVCTFRLILKNAASLLDDADPIKLNANEALDTLISSFDALSDVLSNSFVGSSLGRDKIMNAFNQANIALDGFENGVRECLGIS